MTFGLMASVMKVGRRASYDVPRLFRTVGPRGALAYAANSVVLSRQVARRRSLAPVDFAMRSTLDLTYRGQTIRIPVGAVDRVTSLFDSTPVFGGIREMFVQDCYLRGFASLPTGGAVLDLGANRGMFDLIAVKVLGAEQVIAVEPRAEFAPVGELLVQENGIAPGVVSRRWGYVAPSTTHYADAPTLTLEELRRDVPGGRFAFCKSDIEGGEFALADEGVLLDCCETIAAEVHPFAGSVRRLLNQIRDAGFETVITDRVGNPCHVESAEYVYASKQPGLLRTSLRHAV